MLHCEKRVTGTSYPAMNASDVGDFVIHLMKNEKRQENARQFLDDIDNCSSKIGQHITKANELQRWFVESVFS